MIGVFLFLLITQNEHTVVITIILKLLDLPTIVKSTLYGQTPVGKPIEVMKMSETLLKRNSQTCPYFCSLSCVDALRTIDIACLSFS